MKVWVKTILAAKAGVAVLINPLPPSTQNNVRMAKTPILKNKKGLREKIIINAAPYIGQ